MIEVEHKDIGSIKSLLYYPRLRIVKHSGAVVLFSSRCKGTLLIAGRFPSDVLVGDNRDNWDRSIFEEYEDEFIMRNAK